VGLAINAAEDGRERTTESRRRNRALGAQSSSEWKKGFGTSLEKTLSLGDDIQQSPGTKAIEPSGPMEGAMGIEPITGVWVAC
jgi:hypothetical protein